jgi:hypothetical protein
MSANKNVLWIIADQLRGQALGYAGDRHRLPDLLDRQMAPRRRPSGTGR